MRVHKCNHRGERKYTYAGKLSAKDAHSIVIQKDHIVDVDVRLVLQQFSPPWIERQSSSDLEPARPCCFIW